MTYRTAFRLGLLLPAGGLVALGLYGYSWYRWLPLDAGPPPPPGAAPDVVPADPGRVRIAAIGDAGVGDARQEAVARGLAEVCQARGCDVVLYLGDNLYPVGMESADDPRMDAAFGAIYADVPAPFYAVLGNHDYGGNLDRQKAAWQVAWAGRTDGIELPAPRYSFSVGPVDLFAVDTTEVFWNGPDTHEPWLGDALAASEARWKILFGHHNYKSEGPHGNAGRYEGQDLVPYLTGVWLEEFFADHVCRKVDLVLSGHDHTVQWIEACDTPFVVSGAGAKKSDLVGRGNRPQFARGDLGFAWFELRPEEMTLAFYDDQGRLQHEAIRGRDGQIRAQ